MAVSILAVILAVAGAGLVWGCASFFTAFWRLRKFPGPVPMPLIGNLYDSRVIRFMSYMVDLWKTHGHYFVFWRGNSPMLVVTEPNAVRQILTKPRDFVKGADYTEKFSVAFGQGLVTSMEEVHKKDKECLGKYFVRTSIDDHLGTICTQARKMMDEVIEPSIGKTLDMQDYFHLLTLRIFGKFALSHDFSLPENRETAKWVNWAVSWGSNVIGEHIVLGIPMWNCVPRVPKFRKMISQLSDVVAELLDARILKRERGDPDVPDDSLNALLDANLSRQRILDHLITLLSAGHDTTAYFGCYMTYLLANNPEVQDKAKEEIRRVIGNKTELTSADINELKYCRMVLQETLRLYTIIPFITRQATQDVQIADTKRIIPKDTTVMIPLNIMNRDPEVWDKPSEFRPERFANITGHNSAKHGYLPFGYGSRGCIGNTLALVEGTVMISLLLQRYRFTPEPGFKPQVIGGISLVSKNGVLVRVEREEGTL